MTDNLPGNILQNYYLAIEQLKSANIIRGDSHDGNIGEHIASVVYSVNLLENQRAQGIDGHIGESSVQVKYSSSTERTNINVGEARNYDILILILFRTSRHIPEASRSDFVGYLITRDEVISNFTESNNGLFTCTRNQLAELEFREISFADLN